MARLFTREPPTGDSRVSLKCQRRLTVQIQPQTLGNEGKQAGCKRASPTVLISVQIDHQNVSAMLICCPVSKFPTSSVALFFASGFVHSRCCLTRSWPEISASPCRPNSSLTVTKGPRVQSQRSQLSSSNYGNAMWLVVWYYVCVCVCVSVCVSCH